MLPTNRERLGQATLGKDTQHCLGSIPGHDRDATGIDVSALFPFLATEKKIRSDMAYETAAGSVII